MGPRRASVGWRGAGFRRNDWRGRRIGWLELFRGEAHDAALPFRLSRTMSLNRCRAIRHQQRNLSTSLKPALLAGFGAICPARLTSLSARMISRSTPSITGSVPSPSERGQAGRKVRRDSRAWCGGQRGLQSSPITSCFEAGHSCTTPEGPTSCGRSWASCVAVRWMPVGSPVIGSRISATRRGG